MARSCVKYHNEIADKQKAVPKEADLASFGTVFLCSKIISELKNVVIL